jgi:hypothetical protein
MSGADQAHDDHAASSHDLAHAGGGQGHHADAHGEEHGHGDEALGPIDLKAWGAAVLGIASGLLVFAVMYLAIHPA